MIIEVITTDYDTQLKNKVLVLDFSQPSQITTFVIFIRV